MSTSEVAVVTGAAGALGAEVVRALVAAGHRLVLLDSERASARLAEIAAGLGGALTVTGDLSLAATWDVAMARARDELGATPSVAALVAGAWRGGASLHEEDDAVWEAMRTANVETVHRGLRALLPDMVARRRGSVVAVGSRAAVQPWTSARSAAYAASKAAVVALVQAVSAEVADYGVRVNAVLPSTLDTAANRAAMPGVDARRWVSTASAAGVIAFLLSDAARDVSGAAIPVYGRA